MWATFDTNFIQAYLSGAEGQYLDLIGAMLGLPRLGEKAAQTTASEQICQFSVATGTFGTINNGQSIDIPANTIISTGPNSTGILYRTIYETILASNTSSSYVSIEALGSGSDSNVGAGQLVYHNFTNYTQSAMNTLLVTNQAEITTGSDVEIDTNYRFRLANQVIAAESANLTAVRLAALVVPGVADVRIIPYFRGVGSFDMLIKATTPSVSQQLIATVGDAVGKASGLGIAFSVRGPVEDGIALQATLTYKTSIDTDTQTSIENTVAQNLTSYINNLDIAAPLIVNQLVEIALQSSSQIQNIGAANKPFDNIWVYKPSATGDNKVRATLPGDFYPDEDAKCLIESQFAGPQPILIVSNT
jgi:uncharacterized phage protein gp47/JayE